jgi:hypothetical protein
MDILWEAAPMIKMTSFKGYFFFIAFFNRSKSQKDKIQLNTVILCGPKEYNLHRLFSEVHV